MVPDSLFYGCTCNVINICNTNNTSIVPKEIKFHRIHEILFDMFSQIPKGPSKVKLTNNK